MDTPFPHDAPALTVVDGKARPLTREHRRAIAQATAAVRRLDEAQAALVTRLLAEFDRDGFLERMREIEAPALLILAEVLNGWDVEGVREFARAWASTLVARRSRFDWDASSREERARHRLEVDRELSLRGIK